MKPTQTVIQKIFRISPVFKYKIIGNSMFPTLQSGEIVLVNRLFYLFAKLKIGDIVALKDPRDEKILIKRIYKIGDSKYFVLGDNQKESTDSRAFGWITKKDIIGKVKFKT
jgi:nickel-type superoxide dismutase maturation protease